MDKKEKILQMYFEEHQKQDIIAETVGVSQSYISQVVQKDTRYTNEKEIRHNESMQKKAEYTFELFILLALTIFFTTLGTSFVTFIPFLTTKLLEFLSYWYIDLFHLANAMSDISDFVDRNSLSLFNNSSKA